MKTGSRILAIDALRAVAVLSVVVYHLNNSFLPGGFAGVDVFFVISGYVVTRALANHVGHSWHHYLQDFYVRRILRIFPALVVCLLVTLVAEALLVPRSWLSSQNFDTARAAFFGLSNIFLSNNQEGYFSPRVEFNPYVHTWSLGVEEQFYVVLPLLYFAQRRLAGHALGPSVRHALLAICALSFGLSLYESLYHPASAYYSLGSRFWELGLGACLAERHRIRGTSLDFSRAARLLILGASTALLIAGLLFADQRYFPVPFALLAVAGTLGLIDLAARRGWAMNTAMLPARAIVYIGTISYSLYLWHWPVFAIARWTSGLGSWGPQVLSLMIVAILASASYHFVEQPFQRRWFFAQRRWAVLVFGMGAILGGLLIAKGVDRERSAITLSVTRDVHAWYPYNWSSSSTATGCHTEASSMLYQGLPQLMIKRKGCDDTDRERTLFVAGDSHAGAYETLLGRFATERPFAVRLFFKPNCPFLSFNRSLGVLAPDCAKFVRTSLQDIARLAKPGDILFLPSRRMVPFANQWGDRVADPADPAGLKSIETSVVNETATLIQPIVDAGVRVVFEAPTPVFPSPAFRCSDWFNRGNPVCANGLTVGANALQERRRFAMNVLTALQTRHSLISVWDPFPILCPDLTCRAVDQGVPLFFDGDHLSGGGNERLFGSFDRFIGNLETASATLH